MDHVVIEGLRIDTTIGVYDWEKSVRQTLYVDLELACDIRRAASCDALVDAVDYANLVDRIEVFARANHFQLIETLAERIAGLILNDFPVRSVKLYLRKPDALRQACSAGVRIERSHGRDL